MKKILVTTAMAGIVLAACNKKNATPAPNEAAEPTVVATQDYKYRADVRVYDDSKTYYVDVNIKSNYKSVIEANVANLNNSRVVLLNEEPVKQENGTLKTTPQKNNIASLKETELSTVITFKKIYKGSAKGVRLAPKSNIINSDNNKTDYLQGPSPGGGTTIVYIGVCNYYTMYGLNDPQQVVIVNDYFYDNGLHYIQSGYVYWHTTTYFSGTGALYRIAYCSSATSNWVIDIELY